ncbi:X2-like carbohydrate binding domain-containing protein [Anaerostipes sp.]|uniref:X2-like carbohydrate binding domain-containing protein n=1 Tax=Anaerostipes sp. TaxID=1872530 RepID=UPI0025BA78CE|nr:X2-like carbohydrate binding domain-containing protein [Anaerostipes sp.]MBS7008031.1 hypothetical protein [Anaerostipes sp.]
MKKLKQLCSVMLCIVMVTVFTITPIRADEGTTTTTISGTASITGTVAQFSEDKDVKASLSKTSTSLNVTLEATIGYKDGTVEKTIKSTSTAKTTSTDTDAEVIFQFARKDLNLLPAGTYEIKAKSTASSANSVKEATIGSVTVNKETPSVTIDKSVTLTKSRSDFEAADGEIKAKLDKAFFSDTNPAALELTASIKDSSNTVKFTAKANAVKNGEVTFTFTQADLNTLPEGDFTITVTSAGNAFNNEITDTTLGTIKITPMKNATVKTPQKFDLSKQTDIVIGIENNGRTLKSIKNGSQTLASGKDYTVGTDYVTISKDYFSQFAVGTQYLTFDFDEGSDPICQVDIFKSLKKTNLILKGYKNKSITTLSNKTAGSKLPEWNKRSYKAAGRKGYQFAGWTYNGKTVTTVPDDRLNVTLTAKFSKLSVGRASALSVKGKSGKGVGFVATSKTSTKADGSKRAFRFRYSRSSSMKKATYKTTGLGKNVYTKTGLKKNARYYVQVRYYYYDSTNQKVYGAYSKSKSVKAY